MSFIRHIARTAAILLICGAAQAAPMLWTLNGVALSDGGTASGSFIYDPVADVYSSINITTTSGTLRTGATYSFACTAPCAGLAPSSTGVLNLTVSAASDLTGTPGLALFFASALTSSGGSISVTGQEANCSNATCDAPTGATRSVAGAVMSDVASVPTLSQMGLVILFLLVAFVTRATIRPRT
jgi:hypothetical protein